MHGMNKNRINIVQIQIDSYEFSCWLIENAKFSLPE